MEELAPPGDCIHAGFRRIRVTNCRWPSAHLASSSPDCAPHGAAARLSYWKLMVTETLIVSPAAGTFTAQEIWPVPPHGVDGVFEVGSGAAVNS